MSTEDRIHQIARLEFDDVGFADTSEPTSLAVYDQWLQQGLHGQMEYLKRHRDQKANPQLLLPGAQSFIVLTLGYDSQEPLSVEAQADFMSRGWGWIARYARGRDYHDVIGEKLKAIVATLKKEFPEEQFLSCVDTYPVLEREAAYKAGLGWIGKNSCLIHPRRGSFFFIAEVLTTLKLTSSTPQLDHCGTCTRCLDACPTQALLAPRQLDANRCISYWTIESKQVAPPELGSRFGFNIFGCDICQDVCPWNQKARKQGQHTLAEPAPAPVAFDLRDLLKKSDAEIKNLTKGTAMARAKPRRIRENAEQALKNIQGFSMTLDRTISSAEGSTRIVNEYSEER